MTKLTTDLIADCMALIPQNLERLNGSQVDYLFEVVRGKVVFTPAISYNTWGLDGHLSPDRYMIISHCLRIIPEFQKTYKLTPRRQSIASATLHGQGEYPPSTLEELCESYKNVMS